MEWSFLINPFLSIAKRSRKKAIKVSSYSDAALEQRQADAFFGPLYTLYHPLHVALMDEETEYGVQKGTQKGATKSVDDLLKELSPVKINLWHLQIGVVFNPGTPQYVAIFPNGISPFGSTAKKDDRIEAVRILGESLDGIVPLAAVKTAVDTFYASLIAARTGQKGEISNTKDESDDVTAALEAAMIGLYSVLGSCIAHFSATPLEIKPIFDIPTIMDRPQTEFVDTVKKGATDNVFKRTLKPDQKVKITVLTDKKLEFSITDEKNDPVQGTVVTVSGLEDEIVDASQLKVTNSSSFFKVHNPDGDVDGHFKIELL